MSNIVAVQDLRIGMFVQLDLPWMSHPFARSSFLIDSEDKIATIRSLGVTHVVHHPEKSKAPPEPRPNDVSRPHPPSAHPPPITPADSEAAIAATVAGDPGGADAALATQRAAQAVAERHYAQACQAWRASCEMVEIEPIDARISAEHLTRSLLDKMVGDKELCIRLLNSGAGDRATAHALNVTIISLLLGRTLQLDENEMMELGVGAMLHDIGKLQVAHRLRFPSDDYTNAEQTAYREHVVYGVRTGARMQLSNNVILVLAQHHEMADGSGFPWKLPLAKMSQAARIVALVNRYDNLCNPAVASKALTPHDVVSSLFVQGEKKYDARLLSSFIRMIGVYPPGSVVQLTDERYAMVVSVNSSRPLKPGVMVYDPKASRKGAIFVNLEQAPEMAIRRSLQPSQLPKAAQECLAPAQRVAYFFEPYASGGDTQPADLT